MRNASQFAAIVNQVQPSLHAERLGYAFDKGMIDPVSYFNGMTQHIPASLNNTFVDNVRQSSIRIAGYTIRILWTRGFFTPDDMKKLSVYGILTDVGALSVHEFLVECWTLAQKDEDEVVAVFERFRLHALEKIEKMENGVSS